MMGGHDGDSPGPQPSAGARGTGAVDGIAAAGESRPPG